MVIYQISRIVMIKLLVLLIPCFVFAGEWTWIEFNLSRIEIVNKQGQVKHNAQRRKYNSRRGQQSVGGNYLIPELSGVSIAEIHIRGDKCLIKMNTSLGEFPCVLRGHENAYLIPLNDTAIKLYKLTEYNVEEPIIPIEESGVSE